MQYNQSKPQNIVSEQTHPHIITVNTIDGGGGAARIARTLHRGYAKQGFSTSFLVGNSLVNNSEKPEAQQLSVDSEYLLLSKSSKYIRRPEEIESDRLAGREIFDYYHSHQLLRVVTSSSSENSILHLHNLHGGYFDLRILPELTIARSVIITAHDAWLLSGNCAHSFDCERWMIGCGKCPDISIYPGIANDLTDENYLRKREIFSRSNYKIVTPSEWLADKFNRSFHSNYAREIIRIPNGVKIPETLSDRIALRSRHGLPQDAFIIAFAAHGTRSNPWKNHSLLKIAVLGFAQENKRIRVILLSIGEQGETVVKDNVADIPIPYITNERLFLDLLELSDVYLHISKQDTFPNTILEAQSVGTPVIASDICGIPEQISDIRGRSSLIGPPTGYLVDNEIESIKATISDFYDARGSWNVLRDNSRISAVRWFDEKNMIKSYSDLLLKTTNSY